jgi:predicted phage tail protein
MLTTVILDGEMGKLFGREHKLSIKSARQALALIDVNVGGLMRWVQNNASKFNAYRILVEYLDGRKEALDDKTFLARRGKVKSIRFVPTFVGAGGGKAGGILQVVVGVAMLVVAFFYPVYAGQLVPAGLGLIFGGISTLLAPKPKTDTGQDKGKSESYYFSGAENPVDQGQPVPLIYGRVKVGAQAISAGITIDQLK